MAHGLGLNAYIGWGEESTYGTAVAGAKWAEIETESLKGRRPLMPAKVLGSISQRRTLKSKATVDGSFRFPFCWNGHEQLLKHAFGDLSVTTTGANPYTHTLALKAAMPVGLTLLANRDAANLGAGSMFRYAGCHINKLRLAQKLEEPLMLECDILGSDFANVTIQAATFPAFDPIEYGMMTIANFDQAGTPYGMLVRDWQLEIDNMLESKFRLLDYKSKGVVRVDHRMVTFSCEMEFENLTVYSSFRDATTEDYRFKWMKDSGVDTVNTLQLDIPKAFLESEEPETGGPGPYYLTIKGRALFNAADNDELALVLKNTTSTV